MAAPKYGKIEQILDAEASAARERVARARALYHADYTFADEYRDAIRALSVAVGRTIDFKFHGTIPGDLWAKVNSDENKTETSSTSVTSIRRIHFITLKRER